jgi:hypothetical protein
MGFSMVLVVILMNGDRSKRAVRETIKNRSTPSRLLSQRGNSFLASLKYNSMDARTPAKMQRSRYQEGSPVIILKSKNLKFYWDKL